MERLQVSIPIIFNTSYPIKSEINPKWVFTDIIYEGLNDIYIACSDNNCEYVAKIIEIRKGNDFDEFNCYSSEDKAKNELIISKLMSDNGIGPTIYDMSINDTQAVMIMERYDSNLEDLFWMYQIDQTIPMDKILNDLADLIRKMHSSNIAHIDLHMGNILIKSGNSPIKVAIADFGQSLLTASQKLKDEDWASFEGIVGVYNQINQGDEIIDKEYLFDVYFDLTPPSPYNFVFTWNNEPCQWYI